MKPEKFGLSKRHEGSFLDSPLVSTVTPARIPPPLPPRIPPQRRPQTTLTLTAAPWGQPPIASRHFFA
jgi:hypothetical protein